MRKPFEVISLLLLLSVLVMPYQNCSPEHSKVSRGETNGTSLELNSATCKEISDIFNDTYRPFLQTNCASCHINGGIGKGAFADNDFDAAWSAFQFAGFETVSSFAVNPAHKPPYTGDQHTETINGHRETWRNGLAEIDACQKQSLTETSLPPEQMEQVGPRINTIAKKINLTTVGESAVLQWDLSSELESGELTLPELPGAKAEITVELVEVLGQIAYYISNPQIKDSNVDIHLESLRIQINGEYVPGETTFNFVDEDIHMGTETLISSGTMVALGMNQASDELKLSFGKLEATLLNPPVQLPKITFSKGSETLTQEGGVATVDVTLSEAITSPVVVTIDLLRNTSAKVRRSERTQEAPYDFFDWDATLGTVDDPVNTMTLTFIPGGPTSRSVDVLIAADDRVEGSEKARIEMTAVNGAEFGSNKTFEITIPNDPNDTPPANPFIKTYSQLMTGNGILVANCLECHNTVRKDGGYDMTDYNSMASIEKGILKPGSPNESEMYIRLNLQGPGRMPLEQALSAGDQREIENWILSGAKNN